MQITREFVEKAISQTAWDFGNGVLYDLCERNPKHDQDSIIIAKIWLIGRSYSAAIERRLNAVETPIGDRFYEDIVAPRIRDSHIDKWFESVKDPANTESSLELHGKVTRLFSDISGMQKRSLASKYLHFHFPTHFYIFDSRACSALRQLTVPARKRHPVESDKEYAAFYYRCGTLSNKIKQLIGRRPSPRELDKVLLAHKLQSTLAGDGRA